MFWKRKKEKYYTTAQVIEILQSIIDPTIKNHQYYINAIQTTIKVLTKIK